jgi:uncharacterized membrane protein
VEVILHSRLFLLLLFFFFFGWKIWLLVEKKTVCRNERRGERGEFEVSQSGCEAGLSRVGQGRREKAYRNAVAQSFCGSA